MKRPITLAVDVNQYNVLYNALLRRMSQNDDELKYGYIGTATKEIIKQEQKQISNLLDQMRVEFAHVFTTQE